jgi:hypothetical protein
VFFSLLPLLMTLLVSEYLPLESGESGQTTFYASPNGGGSDCTQKSPCSLTGAKDKVRTVNGNMNGDINVYLRGGTYTLTAPFELTGQDSGTNSHYVIYSAYHGETPVISGGQLITGWTIFDSDKNIYKAHVDPTFRTRQLFVNGNRAIRARDDMIPAGLNITSTGYTLPSSGIYSNMANWDNKSDIETITFDKWTSSRCGVADIHDAEVTMARVCWDNIEKKPNSMSSSIGFENAYELLDSEGEWYWNHAAGDIFYKPKSGEVMSSAVVVAPIMERLVIGTGSENEPIQNIQFTGITFAYATWLRTSTELGYIPSQAGITLKGPNGTNMKSTAAHIQFQMAKHIVFKQNIFTHLGGAALTFDRGSQNNSILGNKFEDISSHAIQIGNVNDKNTTGTKMVKDNIIKNNYIHQIGREYQNAVGIFVGYASGTTVDHNEIFDVPYSAISIGWGWTDKRNESLQNNHITNNLIHDFMTTLNDGGAIYTLSRQDDSVISGNYIHHNHNDFGSIYLDQGSYGFTVTSNVVSDPVSNWVFAQDSVPPYTSENIINNNFTDTKKSRIFKNNTAVDNTVIKNGNWPKEAKEIMDNAGLEPIYVNIK